MKKKPKQFIDKSNGYIYVYKPDHPNAKSDGCIALHRLKYAQKKGRKLRTSEYVHHKDGNKKNNHLHNLIGENVSKHTAHHNHTRILRKKRRVIGKQR